MEVIPLTFPKYVVVKEYFAGSYFVNMGCIRRVFAEYFLE
jgi:hypothetical protein